MEMNNKEISILQLEMPLTEMSNKKPTTTSHQVLKYQLELLIVGA